jgi:hypothetical protein
MNIPQADNLNAMVKKIMLVLCYLKEFIDSKYILGSILLNQSINQSAYCPSLFGIYFTDSFLIYLYYD